MASTQNISQPLPNGYWRGYKKYAYSMAESKSAKSYQHLRFPSGPPPQYLIGLKPLNFGVRMGSGAFGLVWPIAINIVGPEFIYSRTLFLSPLIMICKSLKLTHR